MHKMLQTAIKRIIGDKVLLGLVIVGMLGIFVGAFCGDDPSDKKNAPPQPQHQAAIQSTPTPAGAQTAAQPAKPAQPAMDAGLATDFVRWWVSNGFDFQQKTAHASHVEAFKWMDPVAASTFQQNLWTPQFEAGVTSGHVVAAFQPITVQAEAMNPDGTIVVGVTGSLVIQQNGQPYTSQLSTDFLVRQDKGGVRIANLYNHPVAAPPPQPQPVAVAPTYGGGVPSYGASGPQY
jgi:hypothetical protein